MPRSPTRHASRAWPLLACLLVLGLAGIVHAAIRPDNEPLRASATAGVRPQVKRMDLSGHVGGLYPGVELPLPVKVQNRSDRTLVLTKIRANPRDAGPGCRAGNIRVRDRRLRVRIAAHREAWVRLRVTMKADAANACQDARFPIRFRARARVGR